MYLKKQSLYTSSPPHPPTVVTMLLTVLSELQPHPLDCVCHWQFAPVEPFHLFHCPHPFPLATISSCLPNALPGPGAEGPAWTEHTALAPVWSAVQGGPG